MRMVFMGSFLTAGRAAAAGAAPASALATGGDGAGAGRTRDNGTACTEYPPGHEFGCVRAAAGRAGGVAPVQNNFLEFLVAGITDVFENGHDVSLSDRLGRVPRKGFEFGYRFKKIMVHQPAQHVPDGGMNFLHERRAALRHDQRILTMCGHGAAASSAQPHSDQSHLPRHAQGLAHVVTVARSGDADQHVARTAQSLYLFAENLPERVVIADRRQGRRVRGQGNGRQWRALHQEAVDQFRREMLGISRAAPVAAEKNLAAVHQAPGHDFGRFGNEPGMLREKAFAQSGACVGMIHDYLPDVVCHLFSLTE